MNYKANALIHFILGSQLLCKMQACHVPRVGEHVQLQTISDEKYYKVSHVTWVFNDREEPYDIVNIEVTEINPGE